MIDAVRLRRAGRVGARRRLGASTRSTASWCAERGVVSTFIRFHPLFENHREAAPGVHAAYSSPTVGWPLDGDLLAGMHGKHRNTVRKAMKAGVAVEAIESPAISPRSSPSTS